MNTKVIGIIVIILIAVVGIFYITTRRSSAPIPSAQVPAPLQPTVSPKPLSATSTLTPAIPVSSPKAALRSQPGTVAMITSVAMSKSIAANGAAIAPKTTFSSTDPVIYAVLSIKNATQRTELSYVRYYAGKYVDSKVSHPTKDGVQYFHFDWTLKSGQTHKTGNYTLNFYVNGKKAKSINYTIR